MTLILIEQYSLSELFGRFLAKEQFTLKILQLNKAASFRNKVILQGTMRLPLKNEV